MCKMIKQKLHSLQIDLEKIAIWLICLGMNRIQGLLNVFDILKCDRYVQLHINALPKKAQYIPDKM